MKSSKHMLALIAGISLLAFASAADARPVRGGAAQGMHHASGASMNRGANVNRGASVNRDVNRNTNRNVNRNVNRDIDVDVDHDWDHDHHPIAAGVAFGTAAAVTAAAIGSMAYTLPPACSPYTYTGVYYYSCGGVWYQPQYQGDQVTYIVVEDPH